MQPWTWPLLTQQTPYTFGRVNELHRKVSKSTGHRYCAVHIFNVSLFSLICYFHQFAKYLNFGMLAPTEAWLQYMYIL